MNDNLTLEDAQKFTQLFRRTLPAENYDKFCEFLDGFLKLEIDSQELVFKTRELIKGNETLAREFLKFLPISSPQSDSSTATAGEKPPAARRRRKKTDTSKSVLENYCLQRKGNRRASKKRIWELTDDEEKKAACVKFLYQVKDTAEDFETFCDFLDMMVSYEMHKDVDRVNKEACELFKNQPELLYEFSSFVADAFDERDRKKEREKGIAMANKTLSKELCLSEFTLKWMEMGRENLRANSEEIPVKKKQKREMMPENEFSVADDEAAAAFEEVASYLSEIPRKKEEEEEVPTTKRELRGSSDETISSEELNQMYLSEIPMKKEEEEEVPTTKQERGSSDETISSEEPNQMYDDFANVSSDGEELYCEEMVVGTELSLAVPASRLELPEFVSTDLVLPAPACRVGAC